ncbi:MAG: LysR substrate-binding domain-containing protein [Gammaproteobacteria bacterium]
MERGDRGDQPGRSPRGLLVLRNLRRAFVSRGARATRASGRAGAASLHQSFLAAHRGKCRTGCFPRAACGVQASLRGHIALDDENSYVAAAEAGLGIAQIPAFVLKEAMERGSLELVLGDWFPEPSPLYVVYPQNRHLSSKIRVFVDWVAELLRDHDGIQLRSTLR